MRVHIWLIAVAGVLFAINKATADDPHWLQPAKAATERGLKFLAANQQPDGGWRLNQSSDPAVTALVAKCFIQSPDYGPTHPIVKRALDFVLRNRRPDGGIYVPDAAMPNYQTSVAVMALAAASRPEYTEPLAKAKAFLINGQWDEPEDIDKSNPWYGGAGYGHNKRPDLSNTQMMLEALHQSGLPEDDPVFQKAIVFIQRSQLVSETNDLPFARGLADGGFIYTPVNGGESKAGTVEIGGEPRMRTYGSMTYAGFKSLLYAGLSHNDPRVEAAFRWIRNHYTLDENPNMPGNQSKQGLFYFYHVFARALDAFGHETIEDANGVSHPWRRELCEKLVQLQRSDGSWVNNADRWCEGNPFLVSAYAILSIQEAARGS